MDFWILVSFSCNGRDPVEQVNRVIVSLCLRSDSVSQRYQLEIQFC